MPSGTVTLTLPMEDCVNVAYLGTVGYAMAARLSTATTTTNSGMIVRIPICFSVNHKGVISARSFRFREDQS